MCRSWSGGSGRILRSPNKWAPRDPACARREALKVQPWRFAPESGCSPPELATAPSRSAEILVGLSRDWSCSRREVSVRSAPTVRLVGDAAAATASQGGAAFGVPQRGTAYQPGVKPRVWRTTERSEGTPHTPGYSHLFCGGGVPGLAPGACWRLGAPRDRSCARRERWDRRSFRAVARRDQDVDVPTLAPARSRCRFVDWGYVPLWGGLSVANEEKQSSLTRCVGVMALGTWRRWGLWGR